jgi:hypothetical protein
MFKALLLALLVAGSSPQQFDLICTGTATDANYRTDPITRRYRVDLAATRWCVAECTVRPISEVNNTQIVFDESKAAYRGDPSERLDYVDRTTGKWSFFTSYWQGEGTCEPAPFSGFGSERRRF